ncbi:helix-turn-helix domain-containing protein [Streptomycetaceae bacterium NBC_01309]
MTRDWVRLGLAVAAARNAHGWTQEELADLANLGRSTVQAIEGGRKYVRIPSSVLVLERVLGWPAGTVEEILAGGDAPAIERTEPAASASPRDQFARGMPLRIAQELATGDVVETAVLDLSDDAAGVRLVVVLKADDARTVNPARMQHALDKWVQAERKLRGLPTRDVTD